MWKSWWLLSVWPCSERRYNTEFFCSTRSHREDLFDNISCEKYVTEPQFLDLGETHEIATELFSMIIRIDSNLGSYRVSSWGRGCTEMPASACILLWALYTSQPGFWSRIHVSLHILKVLHLVKNKYWCMYLQNHNPLHYGHANVFRSGQGSLSKRADG